VFGGVTLTSPPPSGADMARSQRRAQAVARLRHPNLVRLLPLPGGAGLSPVLGDARRLADFTLPAGTFKRFDLEQVVRLLLDVLSGLAALHEVVTDGRAFVHGQVSPQHIYIDEHGTARLVPLLNGAKLEDAGYTAPERLVGSSNIDARADVFSVGVMLWEALAGKRLFPKGLAQRSLDMKPPPLELSAEARWALPLCALAERAISLEPAARFASALELSNAMAAAAAQQLSRVDTDAWQDEAPTPVFQPRLHLAKLRASTPPPSVITIVPAPAAEPAPIAAAPLAVLEESRVPTRGRRVGAALVGFALLSLAAAGFLLWKSPRSWQRAAAFAPALLRAPAAASPPVPMPVPLLASPAPHPPAAALSAPPSTQLVPSAAASASVSAPAAASAAPLVAPQSKRKGLGRPNANDYGI
jgi:eukaryotic-like serine/threonine-protein kinase